MEMLRNTLRCSTCELELPTAALRPRPERPRGFSSSCLRCRSKSAKLWCRENKDRYNERQRAWRAANTEKTAAWREANRETVNAATRAWAAANKAYDAARKSLRRSRTVTPDWADRDCIAAIYSLAEIGRRETGMDWQVDHHYPLQGRRVSGLHVETNLRLMLGAANAAKGNRMPEEAAA